MKKFTLVAILSLMLIGDIYSQTLPFTYTYTGKPRFQILTKRNNAVLGIINVELFPKIAPRAVRNFDSLVATSFYDTTAFHRVIPGFVIQGGDPNSRHGPKSTWGQGQSSQPTVMAEFSVAHHKRGILSAARDVNINSANSQFFICHADAFSLDGNYSVYGRVTSGLNYVDTIVNEPRDANDDPFTKIEMYVTYIGSNDTIPNPPPLSVPLNDSMNVDTTKFIKLIWKPVSDAVFYHMDFSNDSTFATVTHSVNTTSLQYLIWAGLPSGTKFYWRVSCNNGGHISWSPVWHFKTQMPYINDIGINEKKLSMDQALVFPNPSTGKFNFTNIKKGDKIEIYDVLGKLIYETIVKDNSMVIDLEGREKGMYAFKIINAGSEVHQGKLIIK